MTLERIPGLQNEGDILTDAQYTEHPFATGEMGKVYRYEIKGNGKSILFFGSPHVNSPDSYVFQDIATAFQQAKPDMVYIEGWRELNDRKYEAKLALKDHTLEDTIPDGEPRFTAKLAMDAGTDFESPESDFGEEIKSLHDKGFQDKDIFTFYIYRDIDQYIRQHESPTNEECINYLQPCFSNFRKSSGWDIGTLDFYEKVIIDELNVEQEEKYKLAVDPIPWPSAPQSVFNEISRASSMYRDRYILERIKQGLEKYDRLFIVYGSAHAVKLEPALRALVLSNS